MESLALDVLAEADAAAFLLERTDERRRKHPDDPDQARRLAVELGQLALALEQAGAYIAKHRLTFAIPGSMEEQARRGADLVRRAADAVSLECCRDLANVVRPAHARRPRPVESAGLVRPDPIPESLLTAGGGPWGDGDSEHPVTSVDPQDALADLDAYSLVTRSTDSPSFSVHRLVQDVTRRNLRDDAHVSALRRALRWLNGAFVGDPQDVRTWPTLDPLAPHVHVAATHADHAGIAEPTARLMNDLGVLQYQKARHGEAEPLMRRAWASTSGPTARTTPTSPETSITWPSCSRPPTGWPRPSR